MTVPTMPDRLALPGAAPLDLRFDAEKMAAEVYGLSDVTWRLNRPLGQDGLGPEERFDWRIISLRSPDGDARRTDPGGPGLHGHADTEFLDRCPYHADVLRAIPAPIRAARLMALGPGTAIHDHRDGKLSFPWGTMRLHIPVITNPGAVITVDGQEYHWDAGRLWFADFDRLHRVRNTGTRTRIHLVLDCSPTPRLLSLFPDTYLAELPWRDVLMAAEPVPLQPHELPAFRCAFALPAQFPEWSDEPTAAEDADLPATIDQDTDGLVLSIDGTPRFRLVHIGTGEFRLMGWTEERTIHIDVDAPAPTLRFRLREGHHLVEWTRTARPARPRRP